VGVTAVRGERPVVGTHRGGDARRDGLLTNGEVARALDEVLQEQVVRAIFELTQRELTAVHRNLVRAVTVRGGYFRAGHLFLLVPVRDHEFLRRKVRENRRFALSDDDLFFDTRRRHAVRRRAVRLEGEDHALL